MAYVRQREKLGAARMRACCRSRSPSGARVLYAGGSRWGRSWGEPAVGARPRSERLDEDERSPKRYHTGDHAVSVASGRLEWAADLMVAY